MGKLTFVLGLGAGYVVGTRAGRARYEQLKHLATRAVQQGGVQEQLAGARQQIKQRSADAAVAAGQAALHGAGQTAKNVAVAGFSAAAGKRRQVVQSTIGGPQQTEVTSIETVPTTSERPASPTSDS